MAAAIPFRRDMQFSYGEVTELSPLIRRVIAANPSPFTFHGTGTYIVGRGRVAVIDPGPALAEHVEAVRRALAGETVSHILITHTHSDHSPAARPLQAATGAPIYGFGPHPVDFWDGPKLEEDGDERFAPDVLLRDGDVVGGDGWTMVALHTPGHISNHLCFGLREEKALFTGDHVMGWSTSVVSPPEGNMGQYMASLRRLLERDDSTYYPTHGPRIPDPKPFVSAYIAHREARERQILDCIRAGADTIPAMVERMYRDVDPGLHPAAARSVFAHLIHMAETGRIAAEGIVGEAARYRLV